MPKAIITLITDFGSEDWFVGTMKGVIYSINPQAEIVDVSHQIRPQHIQGAAFIIKSSYRYFPAGTVHLAVVDPGVGSSRKPIVVKAGGHLFVSPDNGILSYVYRQEKVERIVGITNRDYLLSAVSTTFHARDIFAPVAAHLSCGVAIEEIGPQLNIEDVTRFDIPEPKVLKNGEVVGHVIYVDRFGNLITDVTLEFWQEVAGANRGRSYKIKVNPVRNIKDSVLESKISNGVKDGEIFGIREYYGQAQPGEPLALFGGTGHLEISLNRGDASRSLKMDEGDEILISFE